MHAVSPACRPSQTARRYFRRLFGLASCVLPWKDGRSERDPPLRRRRSIMAVQSGDRNQLPITYSLEAPNWAKLPPKKLPVNKQT